MKTESQSFTADESFEIINEMIRKAKQSFSKVSFYFLLWGVLLFIAGIIEFYLGSVLQFKHYYIGWPIAGVLGGIIAFVKGARDGKKQGASTFMDRLFAFLWSAFFVTIVLIIIGAVSAGQNPGPFIIILTGLPTFVSGALMRFKPLIVGGVVFWVIGICSFFAPEPYRPLLFSLAIALGYIVPGLMLKKSEDAV